MQLIKQITPNKWIGGNRCEVLIIHWWDEPHKNPSLSGVVNWLMNPASQVSAHYVVSDRTVYQLAEEHDQAWHARQANSFAIGIEVDPNTPGDTYKTLGELVRAIRSRRGNLPLKRHSDYVNTNCPGSIDLARIEREAKGEAMSAEKATQREVDNVFLGVLHRHVDPSGERAYVGKKIDDIITSVRHSAEFKEQDRKMRAYDNLKKELDDYKKQVNDLKKKLASSTNLDKETKDAIHQTNENVGWIRNVLNKVIK